MSYERFPYADVEAELCRITDPASGERGWAGAFAVVTWSPVWGYQYTDTHPESGLATLYSDDFVAVCAEVRAGVVLRKSAMAR